MSRAALSLDSESSQSTKSRSSSLRVNKPGDAYEVEADRVADTVASGSKLGDSWSFSSVNIGYIQRDSGNTPKPDDEEAARRQAALDKLNRDLAKKGSGPPGPSPQSNATDPSAPSGQAPAPKPNNYGEAATTVGKALLQTDEAKKQLEALKKQPIVKGAEKALDTTAGKVIAGIGVAGAVGGLAAAHQPLPVQPPGIPIGKSGYSVKPSVQGPLNRPSQVGVTLSYSTPKSPAEEKKAKQRAEQEKRDDLAWQRKDLRDFQEGLKSPDQRRQEEEDAASIVNSWVTRPATDKFDLRGGGPSYLSPGLPSVPQIPSPADQHHDVKQDQDKKKDEPAVQRKAEPSATMYADEADVDSVIQRSGRPLDQATRRSMESRIGFDFSKVRVHADARAAESARALGARAYTVGNTIVFAQGRYSPQTTEGRRLLAHELTHVVQQTRPVQSSPAQRSPSILQRAARQVQRFWGIDLPDAKSWLLGKLKGIRGYDLFCVVIGKDLIDDHVVERNSTTLTEAVLKLFDGGPALFEKLKKAAGALETAYQWLLGEIRSRNLTVEYFSSLLDRALTAASPIGLSSWDRVKEVLKEPWDKLVDLASVIAKKVLDFILQGVLESFPLGKKVYELFKKAGSVISRIAADPLSFGKNLFAAVQAGFKNFGTNILKHLGDGLKTWLFEEIGIPGLKMPKEFTFGSIVNLVMQVLGLTWEQRRPQLVEKLGEQVVYFFETAVDVFEKIRKGGFAAIWEMIKEQASNLFDSVLDSIKDWVVKQIVKTGLIKIAALASPVGEVIEVITDIYETVKFFIEKAAKFVALIESIVNSLNDMVEGRIEGAAQKIEDTLANSIPLVLRFLAGIFHLDGIGESIRKIIKEVRKPIDDAIGKVLDIVVAKAKPLWEKGKEAFLGKLAAVKEWWKKPKKFHMGEEEHTVTVEGEGDHPQVYVQSTKTALEHFLTDVKATPKQTKDILKVASQLGWRQGDLQKPADDEKGAKQYAKLTDMLDNLKAREAPPSKISYKEPVDALGGGVEADAYLSSNRPVGSEPNDTDPAIWNDLGADLRKDKSYVRGHLLSMRLGGQGVWKNMMPITNKVNQRMNSRVENPLKKATVPGNNRYYHYNVKAAYSNTAFTPPAADAKKKDRLAAGAQAEQRLVSLSWTVKPAEYDTQSKTWSETSGKLLDEKGADMPITVPQGDFTPPTEK